jgi:hypothetical protein
MLAACGESSQLPAAEGSATPRRARPDAVRAPSPVLPLESGADAAQGALVNGTPNERSTPQQL